MGLNQAKPFKNCGSDLHDASQDSQNLIVAVRGSHGLVNVTNLTDAVLGGLVDSEV